MKMSLTKQAFGMIYGRKSAGLLLLLVGILLSVAIRYVAKARHDVWRAQAIGALSQVHLALTNHRARHGEFPPICVRAGDGNPLLSWRALVLPELDGGSEVLRRLDLTSPWNSPHNARVMASTGDSLSGYFTPELALNGQVCVFAYVGKESSWSVPAKIADEVLGGHGRNILLLCIPSKHVQLLEPVEINERELLALIGDGHEALFVTEDRTFGDVQIVDEHLSFNRDSQ
jgi:hypothetical protein